MEKKSAILIATDLFKSYPGQSQIFITSDESAFFNKADADNHARSLNAEDPIVIEVSLDDIEKSANKKGAVK